MSGFVLLFVCLTLLVECYGGGGFSLYVSSVSGNDHNNGRSPSSAFRTLQRTQTASRYYLTKMSSGHMKPTDINIYMSPGTWRLTETWKMNASDSGVHGHYVNWISTKEGSASISGGRKITEKWQKVSVDNGSLPPLWMVQFTDTTGLQSRHLFGNGKRLQRGVVPHGTNHHPPTPIPPPAKLIETAQGYTTTWKGVSNWLKNPTTVEFVYTQQGANWVEPRCTVQSIEVQNNHDDDEHSNTSHHLPQRGGAAVTTYNIKMKQPCFYMLTHKPYNQGAHYPYYIENSGVSYLTCPGCWYFDVQGKAIYYRATNETEDPNMVNFVMPTLDILLMAQGQQEQNTHKLNPVSRIRFVGVTFEYATWGRPSQGNGYVPIQSGVCLINNNTRSDDSSWQKSLSNVQFHLCRDVHFVGCHFQHLGGFGLDLANIAQHNTVHRCKFEDISGAAVQIGDMNDPYQNKTERMDLNNSITSCTSVSTAVEYSGAVSLSVGYSRNTTIQHNRVSHTSYGGISIGWGWARRVGNYMAYNQVSNNDVFHYKTRLRDGGGIYTLSTQQHSIMNENWVHDQVIHEREKQGAYYYDEGSAYWTAKNNVAGVSGSVDWLFIWTNTIHSIVVEGTYTNTTNIENHGTNITVKNTHQVTGTSWPATAKAIMAKAGPR
eukprot:TRINITY_DN57797_c0_g1_i2.p1 TRINITY_DN57797_c0_g1~~TRINITY_DN57797_c0_g1_i2.p1  ORF type:complete len:658 (-),score=32.82 TRINITY_DN57797_c0_g1_i2:131-2104(-)